MMPKSVYGPENVVKRQIGKMRYFKRQKYNARKITIAGETFDSQREAKRWLYLKALEQEGAISGLQRQKKFELIPVQRIDGKVVERACSYIADFVYYDNSVHKVVVEDCKGFRTPEYKIKRKLLLEKYGIRIKET